MSQILSDIQLRQAIEYFNIAAGVAQSATCQRSRCGTIIVSTTGKIIGRGFNSPPASKLCSGERVLSCIKNSLPEKFKSDKTCCMHAEQRAIMDALISFPVDIIGSKLYFIRIDETGVITKAGQPYCTICSKMALDAGISEFLLWHAEGVTSYNTTEYNELSFQYTGE